MNKITFGQQVRSNKTEPRGQCHVKPYLEREKQSAGGLEQEKDNHRENSRYDDD
jgi:hypothetical protein